MTSDLENTTQHLRALRPIAAAFERLKLELPSNLLYHTAAHSEDVLREVVLFALHDNLPYHQIYLLALAAAYHDFGFIIRMQQNETLGAEMAVEALLKEPDLNDDDRQQVKQMILDTELKSTDSGQKQVPSTPLSRYLLDADLSNLGREDFLEKVELVRAEMQISNKFLFYHGTLQLFEAHEWYTPAAKALRRSQKDINRNRLLDLIAKR